MVKNGYALGFLGMIFRVLFEALFGADTCLFFEVKSSFSRHVFSPQHSPSKLVLCIQLNENVLKSNAGEPLWGRDTTCAAPHSASPLVFFLSAPAHNNEWGTCGKRVCFLRARKPSAAPWHIPTGPRRARKANHNTYASCDNTPPSSWQGCAVLDQCETCGSFVVLLRLFAMAIEFAHQAVGQAETRHPDLFSAGLLGNKKEDAGGRQNNVGAVGTQFEHGHAFFYAHAL